jgi:hypothetical protein
MKFRTRYRIATLLIRGLFVLLIGLTVMQAAKAGTSTSPQPKLPTDGSIPDDRHQKWDPSWNLTGKWIVSKTIVSDKAVALNCPSNGYACAVIIRLMDNPNVHGRCTIYMPEYPGYPQAKPPTNWMWLLGKEKAHCEFGYYHD